MKKITLLIFFAFLTVSTFAQNRLPNVQLNSVRLPDGFKLDRKVSVWPDTMQAFNHNNNIYYTLANNDEQLYLVIKCQDPATIKKIVGGGISLRVNNLDQRNSDAKITITYPVLDVTYRARVGTDLIRMDNSRDSSESLSTLINKDLTLGAKQIKVQGLNGVNDSLISIYNKENIKAKLLYDGKILIYKLSIPLKFVTGGSIKDQFYYNIMLNGINAAIHTVTPKHNDDVVTVTAIPKGYSGSSGASLNYERYPTDFWAEYKLEIKK